MKCTNCNNELYFNQQYCGNCGAKVEDQNIAPNVNKKGQTAIFYILLVIFFIVIIGGITLVMSNVFGFNSMFQKTNYYLIDSYEVAIPINFEQINEGSSKYFKSDDMNFTLVFLDVSYSDLIKYEDELTSTLSSSSGLTVKKMYEKSYKNRKYLIIEYNENSKYSYVTPYNENIVILGAMTLSSSKSLNSALKIIGNACDSIREVDFNGSTSSNYYESIKKAFIN